MSPKRIQRQRTEGWRMPEGAVYVGRPSQWGNPWMAGEGIDQSLVWDLPSWSERDTRDGTTTVTAALAVEMYLAYAIECGALWLNPLRGRDLACWCPLDQPCHADVLLELANR